MDFKVILSDRFLSDLKEIVDELSGRAGVEVAQRIGHELLDRAQEAGRNPWIGQPVKKRPGARKILRYSYLIFYDVDETAKTVGVLRVWHGSRDPKTLRLDV